MINLKTILEHLYPYQKDARENHKNYKNFRVFYKPNQVIYVFVIKKVKYDVFLKVNYDVYD